MVLLDATGPKLALAHGLIRTVPNGSWIIIPPRFQPTLADGFEDYPQKRSGNMLVEQERERSTVLEKTRVN